MFCYRNLLIIFVGFFIYVTSCTSSKKVKTMPETPVAVTTAIPTNSTKTDAFLENLLAANPQYFNDILLHHKEWNTQIIYTQINRGVNGIPVLKNYYFNVNPANYFYPASTVKFPVSLLALQRLNELKEKGIDKNTTMITEAGNNIQTAVYNDPTISD